jgi:hypothetical protein
MNLGQARVALAARGFDYLDGASMNLMLNRARNDFEDHWEWPWLRATASGPAPLDLADLKYVKRVSGPDGNGIWGLETENVDTAAPVTSGGRYWYLLDDVNEHVKICLVGNPIAVTVDYIRQTPELDDDLDTPVIPARYHAVWIDWAVIQAYKDSDNFTAAQALQADVNARMQFLIERYETRNRMHSPFITSYGLHEDE